MESIDKIKQKYYEMIPRSFSTKLELFLFSRCHRARQIGNFEFSDIKWFEVTDVLVDDYLRAWNLDEFERLNDGGLTMKEIDEAIELWTINNASLKAELFEKYRLNFITDFFPFPDFEKIYDRDPEKRICHYCHINDKEIELLDAKSQIKTKRPRGYMMEIDRIKANYEYSKENIVLACYWCNNAKSDEFSEPEFLYHIGPGIEKVWELRKKA
jgi:hypothetical protein